MIKTAQAFQCFFLQLGRRSAAAVAALFLFGVFVANDCFAQYPGNAPMGEGPSEDDVLELEEIPDQDLSLPADDTLTEDKETMDAIEEIERQRSKELALSNSEKRAKFTYLGGLMLGFGRPWQVYSLDFGYLRTPNQAFGMYAGGGGTSRSGITQEKAYDMRIVSRGSGFFFRQWFQRPDILSLEVSLGYTSWEGEVSPHGAETDDEAADDSTVLASSFRGTGISAGVGAVLSWVWRGGFHIEWVPVLVHASRFIQKDISRDNEVVRATIKRNIETAALNGLTGLRFGIYF